MKYILPILVLNCTILVRTAQASDNPNVKTAVKYLLKTSKQHALNRSDQLLNRFSKAIMQASDKTQVPWEVLTGISYCESTFRTKARGKVGEIGLMQVHGVAWDHCKVKEKRDVDKHSVEDQLICGGHWLKHSIDKCGQGLEHGISRYMTGDVCAPEKGGRLRYFVKRRMRVIQDIMNIPYDKR